jgi:hypothetical protein
MTKDLERTMEEFYNTLMLRESSGIASARNKYGFIGLYQMGELALDDAGYYNSKDGSYAKNDWIGEWRGKDGIYSLQDFLNNPQVQVNAIKAYHEVIWNKYLKLFYKYEGKVISGITLTKSGMVATAHLVGQAELKKFLSSEGKYIPRDANGVPGTEYLQSFADYNLDFNQDIDVKSLTGLKTTHDTYPSFDIEVQRDAISDVFSIFSSPEVNNPELNNMERFKLIAEQQRAQGKHEYAQQFDSLASQLEAAMSVLGSVNIKSENENA